MSTPSKSAGALVAGHSSDEPNMYNVFDYPALEEMDPSLADGHQVYYEREVPFELRSAASVDIPTEVGALEAIRVKILVKGQPGRLEAARVELTSESNLFFHYVHDMDARAFAEVQENQRLMVDLNDYPTVLLRMLNQCIREPHTHLAVFVMQHTGEARLDFIQNMEYKFVELLSCRFFASPEDMVRAQVAYRYNVVRARMQLLQARLADVNAMVKVKNPSLLLQLQRTPPKFPAGAPAGAFSGSQAGVGGGQGSSPGYYGYGSTQPQPTSGVPRPFR